MSFLGGLFGGSYTPEQGASGLQAQQLYDEQQRRLAQQQQFVSQLQAQGPQAIAQQQMIARQLAGQTQGMGPSIAQRQLAETTGQNVAQQAALLAGQRGAGANVGLLGRQAAQVGAQAQQQAAGQAATLRAQEQLAAQQQLAQLTGQQLGQIQAGQQLGLGETRGAQANVLGALGQYNQAQQQAAQQKGNILGGVLGAAGTILGGPIGGALAGSLFGKKEGEKMGPAFAKGGQVPAMVSPGERYLPPSEVEQVKEGKKPVTKAGEKIPGEAKVKGDSLKNDTVPKTLEEGGIVIPRSVMQSKNPEQAAQKFVAAVLAKQKMKRK